MFTFLLVATYIIFIGLGLPDSVLGAVWPQIQAEYAVPLSMAGIFSTIVSLGSILSSLYTSKLISKLGTGKLVAGSLFLTMGAMFGSSLGFSVGWFCLMAVPLGLGAGAIDTALNNFVALHYKAKHLSWLHCFWGVGAMTSPVIMSAFLGGDSSWKMGYITIGVVLAGVVFIALFSCRAFNKFEKTNDTSCQKTEIMVSNRQAIKIKGVGYAVVGFVFYCALEVTLGLWSTSFLVNIKGMLPLNAVPLVAVYFFGITSGRFFTGFFMQKISSTMLIKVGCFTILIGAVILFLPVPTVFYSASLLLMGLGCAPFYPCLIHDTPKRFGSQASATIIGLQTAAAHTGIVVFPPVLGLIAQVANMWVFPIAIIVLALCILFIIYKLDKIK